MRLFTLAIWLATAAGQDRTFDVQSRLVLVPAVVTDGKGRTVEDVRPDEFVLLDEGRRRAVSVDTFATGVAPVALVVAVQSSGISAAALAKVRKIGSMVQPLITGERGCAALVAFDDRVTWLAECTADAEVFGAAVERLRPGAEKQARMLDAVSAAVDRLRRRAGMRRVLLLISETRDRGSESELEAVIAAAQGAGVAVYAATYSATKTTFAARPEDVPPAPAPPPPPARPGSPALDHVPPAATVDILGAARELGRLGKVKHAEVLTAETGGARFSFTRKKALERAVEKLGAELHTQYLLSFIPEGATPGLHRIDVRLPGRPELRVRARPAYWAVAE